MTKILFLGDSAGTGFGTVTKDLGSALLALGEDVRFVSLNEQPTGELEEPFAGRTAKIGMPDGWLSAGMAVAAIEGMFTGALFEDDWVPETALILGDMGSLKVSPVLKVLPDGFPAFHYVPIEGIGLPPSWAAVWRRITPVAMSEFGADAIAALGLPRPAVVYHGVDTDAFHPVTPQTPLVFRDAKGLTVLRSKGDCRAFLGWPKDDLILFRADRNMPRKRYPSLFRAVAPVLAKHPGVRLIWHCLTLDEGGDLSDEWSKYGSPRMASTGLHDRYGGVDRKVLCAMYAAADIYVSTSAEGFGLTIAESLACGTPAIGLDYSSVPEVIGDAGLVVRSHLIDNIYSYFWAAADEPSYTAAVESLVTDRQARKLAGLRGPIRIREKFSWSIAAHQFRDLFAAAVPEAVAA